MPFVDDPPGAPSYQEILDMEEAERLEDRERRRREFKQMSLSDLLYWITIRDGGPEEYDGSLAAARAMLEAKRERRDYVLRWGYIAAIIAGSGSLAVVAKAVVG